MLYGVTQTVSRNRLYHPPELSDFQTSKVSLPFRPSYNFRSFGWPLPSSYLEWCRLSQSHHQHSRQRGLKI